MLREWKRHQVEEVGLLPHFLPTLYAQRNDRNMYRLPGPWADQATNRRSSRETP
jgi:hypothetical protein